MSDEITNDAEVIDSRDVIARIEDLESRKADNDETLTEEELSELSALQSLAAEAEPYAPDWRYGAQLVRHDYFTSHIEELINDCYEMPADFNTGAWPWRHMKIDFEAAADEAKVDYTEVEFSGVTYFIR
jgi:hypothetical protein